MNNSELLNGSLIDRNHIYIILKSNRGFNLPFHRLKGMSSFPTDVGFSTPSFFPLWSCSSCLGTTLNWDEFLVTVSDPLLAVIIEHFVSFTTKGLALYGVLSLFCSCCFMSTTSAGVISLS